MNKNGYLHNCDCPPLLHNEDILEQNDLNSTSFSFLNLHLALSPFFEKIRNFLVKKNVPRVVSVSTRMKLGLASVCCASRWNKLGMDKFFF